MIQAAVDAGIARGAIEDTIAFVRKYTRPWIDSRQERGSDDVFTISQIGDLEIKLHAAEALLERAGLAAAQKSRRRRSTRPSGGGMMGA